MKINRNAKKVSAAPATKAAKSYLKIIVFVIVFLALIGWIGYLARQATSTIDVALLNTNVYKNQPITYDMCVPYPMLRAEYENLSVVNENGTKKKRIITWEDWEKNKQKIESMFAAYPLMEGDYAQYRSFVNVKTSNKNTVLYSYPGKQVVSFDISGDILTNYKSFLSPGDKINIYAIYNEKIKQAVDSGYGTTTEQEVDVYKSELAFNNIMIADILNGDGESVLDLYTYYNNLTVQQQSALDSNEAWQESTTPETLLVALSPEELDRYYFYKTKSATYECALPQRTSN